VSRAGDESLTSRRLSLYIEIEKGANMNAKVLVADDSGTMRKIIIRSLNAVGIKDIVEAADGDEACTLFQEDQFDLVLTDWNMPGKTGLEVVQTIRASGSKVPIVLITTEGEKSRVLQAIQAGVSDYLVKPFEADSLREKLEKHLGQTAGA
jgi:two-component system chemotaxis response regulator CheY